MNNIKVQNYRLFQFLANVSSLKTNKSKITEIEP